MPRFELAKAILHQGRELLVIVLLAMLLWWMHAPAWMHGRWLCLLETGEAASFSSINAAWSRPELMFEFFFYSVLNFSFLGFGDVTPVTVVAKLDTIMEVLLAFFTVIFLLSDFVSLKDSLRVRRRHED
jgi:hypothetical protein